MLSSYSGKTRFSVADLVDPSLLLLLSFLVEPCFGSANSSLPDVTQGVGSRSKLCLS